MRKQTLIILVSFICIIGVFTGVFVAILTNSSSPPTTASPSTVQEKPKPKTTPISTIKQANAPTDYGSHRQEMLEIFQGVFQKNKFKSIYAGVRHETSPDKLSISPAPDKLTVYVRDGWNYLSDDIKKDFIRTALTVWGTSAKGRGIDINMESFKIEFVHENSNRKVAKWDHIWGEDLL